MRIPQLTFTRFLAAMFIVIFHTGYELSWVNHPWVYEIFKQANISVSYFFVLSGYLMVVGYYHKGKINFHQFILNRVFRIYPLYLVALIILIGISLFKNINYQDLLLNLFMIQSWIPDKALSYNYPSWSLSVEMFFYICFPFLMNLYYLRVKLDNIIVGVVIFCIISQILFQLLFYNIIAIPYWTINDCYYLPILHLNEFLVGNLAGILFMEKYKQIKLNTLILYLGVFIIVGLLLKYPIGINYHNGFLAILFAIILILMSISNDFICRKFASKQLVFLGEISYGFYIFQIPIMKIFSDSRIHKITGLTIDLPSMFLIRLSILIGISALSYLWIEKPLRDYLKRLFTNN
jgi:peptidoglycan/LPS O-acetylase OafA/YrhL